VNSPSIDQIRTAVTYLIALILSIAVHEFGHAFVADRLGDRLPRSQGRVTLNPIAHIDPIGTIVMPLVIAFTGMPLLGWGRPVQTNPVAYTRKLRMKTGHMLVAAAGPAMNLVMAFVVSIIWVVLLRFVPTLIGSAFDVNARLLIRLNLVLMFFNLIPLPPLDGGTVLRGLLPDSADVILRPLQQYGGFILLALLMSGTLSVVMTPVAHVTHAWMQVLFRVVS
jgi:Zn-dependent protease